MRQFIGGIRDSTSVHELLLSVAPPRLRAAAVDVDAAELVLMERDDESSQMRYANALAGWGDAGGYDAEILWDACCIAALGMSYESCRWRLVNTLSGGEQKRLVLEALLRGPDEVLLLDEPDNYLDVPGKQWLEQRLGETTKTILMVTHDRELLNRTAERIVTVESRHVWIHGGGFDSYAQARRDRNERLEELRRRWDEEHAKLKTLVVELRQKAAYNDGMASRYQAALTRLRKFEEAGPPEVPPRDQDIKMRLRGGRTGRRAVICNDLELTGLMQPFDLEIFYGERVAVLGSNGSGKSHFLRLLTAVADELPRGAVAAEPVAHSGLARLGARVSPGLFAQTHARPDLAGRTPCEIVMVEHARLRTEAMSALARYELQACARTAFRNTFGRPAGPVADPATRTRRRDTTAARRTDRQPRSRQRRSATRTGLPPMRVRWSRSPMTVGLPDRSTASWCSEPMASSMNRPTRYGTSRGWYARGVSFSSAVTESVTASCGSSETQTSAGQAVSPRR